MLIVFIFRFLFGAIIGSFLNVAGLRYRSGLTLGGRSACVSCARALKWYELVPVLSFFVLLGRCKSCKTKISWQYPAIELFSGLIFATLAPIYWIPFSIYIVILIYDLRHKIIPDALVYASIAYALVISHSTLGHSLSNWLIGPIFFALFGLTWLVSKGKALGFGDAKLSLSVGLLLGLSQGISAIVLAFWIGTLVTVPLVLKGSKKLTMKSEIPFAPFIILGAWVSLLFHLDLFHTSLF